MTFRPNRRACAAIFGLAIALVGCGSNSDDGRGSGTGGAGGSDAGTGATSSGGTGAPGGAGGATGGSGGSAGSDGGAAGAPSDAPLVGVYTGNVPEQITAFESWLGRPVDGVLGYTGGASWADYDVGWATSLWNPLDRRVFWSVPLIPTGATLEAAASGDYDAYYTQAAEDLATFRPNDAELHVRTGWELNGNWFPWAAEGKEQAFIGAFRRFVDCFRAVSDRFVFEWNVNMGNNGSNAMDPETAYPGDDWVDIIGMDFYWNLQWDPADPVAAWTSMRDRPYGLDWHQKFAAQHGKKTSYSEWGVMSDDAGPYIDQAKLWFEAHGIVFHTYWDSNADFQGKLSGGQYPVAGAAYKTAFGAPP